MQILEEEETIMEQLLRALQHEAQEKRESLLRYSDKTTNQRRKMAENAAAFAVNTGLQIAQITRIAHEGAHTINMILDAISNAALLTALKQEIDQLEALIVTTGPTLFPELFTIETSPEEAQQQQQ